MPKLPVYDSQRNITSNVPAPRARTGRGQNVSDVLTPVETIAKATEKWNEALTTAQLNSFKANQGAFLQDIYNRASIDENPSNAERYFKEIDTYKQNALSGLNATAATAARPELESETNMAKVKLYGMFQKKILANTISDIGTSMTGYEKNAVTSYLDGNKGEEMLSVQKAHQLISQNVNSGILSKDEGKKLIDEFEKNVRVGKINADLYSNPYIFLQNVKEGRYDFADAKEKSDKMKAAQGLIKNMEATERYNLLEERINKRFDVIGKIAAGELNEEDFPDVIQDISSKDPTLGEALQKNMEKGGLTLEKEDNMAFAQLATSIMASEDKEKVTEFLARALEDNKNISRDRLAILVYAAKKRVEELNKRNKQSFMSRIIGFFNGKSKAESNALYNSLRRIQEENADDETAENIVKEEIYKQVDDANFTPREFDSMEAAEKADIAPGEVVVINGKRYIMR